MNGSVVARRAVSRNLHFPLHMKASVMGGGGVIRLGRVGYNICPVTLSSLSRTLLGQGVGRAALFSTSSVKMVPPPFLRSFFLIY